MTHTAYMLGCAEEAEAKLAQVLSFNSAEALLKGRAMSDNLVKRARHKVLAELIEEMANRIEELEAKLAKEDDQ